MIFFNLLEIDYFQILLMFCVSKKLYVLFQIFKPIRDTDTNNLQGVIGGTTAAIIIIILIVVFLVLYTR